MKKNFLFFLAMFLTFGSIYQLRADSRLDGMSADARAIEDMDLIWLYPNKALQYKNTADVRLNDGGSYYSTWEGNNAEWGGILKDAGDLGVLGLYTGRPEEPAYAFYDTYDGGYWRQQSVNDRTDWLYQNDWPMYSSPWLAVGGVSNWDYAGGGANVLQPNNKADLFWAKSLGDCDLGVRASYADNQAYATNGSNDSRDFELHVGVGLATLAPFKEANFRVSFATGSVDNGITGVKDDSIYTVTAGTLLVADMDKENTLRFYGDVNLDHFSLRGAVSPTSDDVVALLGTALNHDLGKGFINTSLTFGYGWESFKTSAAGPVTESAFWEAIWNASLEIPLNGWLTYRTGLTKLVAERYYERNGTAAASYGDAWDNATASLNMGLTANVENFTIDALINVAALENFLGNPNLNQLLYDNTQSTDSGPGPLSLVEVDLKAKI